MKGEISNAALHVVYSRASESVDVYGVSDLTAAKLNAQIKALVSGEGAIAYLVKTEDTITSALLKSGIEASVTIKGATASEK